MIESVLSSLFTLENLLWINVGLAGGIMVGALPGLTGTMAMALLLPLTYGLASIPGVMLLLGVYCGSIYGGSITAILIGTPGTPASAATIPLLQIPEILSPREASAAGREPLQ